MVFGSGSKLSVVSIGSLKQLGFFKFNILKIVYNLSHRVRHMVGQVLDSSSNKT